MICWNVNVIYEKYNLDKRHLEQASLSNCTYDSDKSDDAKACIVREFWLFRNIVPFDSEDYVIVYNNLATIISDLCEQ